MVTYAWLLDLFYIDKLKNHFRLHRIGYLCCGVYLIPKSVVLQHDLGIVKMHHLELQNSISTISRL